MLITQLHIYPIKSLRGISLQSATLCAQGLAFDRRYILLAPTGHGTWTNMFVGEKPEMALFHCEASSPDDFLVSYRTPDPPVASPTPAQHAMATIPFEPDCGSLERINIELHKSPSYPAYRMPDSINQWFSDCFGYEVVLAYLGDGLGVDMKSSESEIWIKSLQSVIPEQFSKVNFSDGAALLVASESSLADLHPRLEDGEKVLLEKFRPNIVVDGNGSAWDEDYWGEITIVGLGARILLTSNCARCTSINIDLEKGRMAAGESGKLLKKMMRDRRIDPGHRWAPIFGRYGFPMQGGEIRIGDNVEVSVRNMQRTISNGVMPRLTELSQGLVEKVRR